MPGQNERFLRGRDGVMMLDVPVEAPPGDGERGFRELPATTPRLVGNAAHPLVIGSPIA